MSTSVSASTFRSQSPPVLKSVERDIFERSSPLVFQDRVQQGDGHRRPAEYGRLAKPAEEISWLLGSLAHSSRRLQRNAYLYRMGDPSDYLFILGAGTVKRCHYSRDGEEQIMGFHSPGDLLGVDGLQGRAHGTAVIALEPADVWPIGVQAITGLASDKILLDRYFTGLLLDQIRSDEQLCLMRAKKSADVRVAMFLLNYSKRAATENREDAVTFRLPMSRLEIGKYLGLTLETVSRVICRFARKNLIEVDRRRVCLVSVSRLAVLAGE